VVTEGLYGITEAEPSRYTDGGESCREINEF